MAFLASIIQTLLKAAVIGAVAFGGIIIGKKVRDKQDAKAAAAEANEAE